MKNSYKLYGSAWDRLMIPRQCPVVKIMEFNRDVVFFKLSELMNEEIPSRAHDDENLILDIDFIPKTKSDVIWDFYLKRMLQIIEFYQAKPACYCNTDYVDILNEKMKEFYKRKTPERLLAQSVGAFQKIC